MTIPEWSVLLLPPWSELADYSHSQSYLYSTLLEVAFIKSQEMEREFCGLVGGRIPIPTVVIRRSLLQTIESHVCNSCLQRP